MAIYKNREVTIIAPSHRLNPPSTIQIQYADGTYETVTTTQVQFTKEEKDALVKNFPSEFDSLVVASEDDVKAVRVGVSPASDPSRKEQARDEARADEARKVDQEVKEKVKSEVKDESKSTPNSVKAK